jgi:ribosomal protein S18 acetylase RimI-like enzyme
MATENALSLPEIVPVLVRPRVRPLQNADRAQVEELIRSDGLFTVEEVAVALELVDDALADDEYLVLVAEEAGRVVGYVCYGDTPMTDGTWDLFWLVTHRDARGRGVARALVTHMERDLAVRGARLVRVETSGGYREAHACYCSLGYAVAARLGDFYRPGDDLVVLTKRL